MTRKPPAFKSLTPGKTRYGNKRCAYKGMNFDSILERDHWIFLEEMQAQGKISGLERQVTYTLEVNRVKVCDMVPDFRYQLHRAGGRKEQIVADAKGFVTEDWRIKAALFYAIYGQKIVVVGKDKLTSLPG